MRTGLSTIQQTLMPEAAAVLDRSIAEAARRNHGQTTPLHVAATLLASPTGFLRQACIRSHPNSSHPLQCRALELCFSVALDRLPSTGNSNASSSGGGGIVREPPLSNALMAALKRAQAHQRRGCPEQQQQPLLALKVELEQLVVSILDDPSVSRVMREASFSSPAVKATIEQSMTTTTNSSSSAAAASSTPTVASNSPSLALSSSSAVRLGLLGLRPLPTTMIPGNRNLYLNPLLQHQQKRMAESGGVGAAPLPAALREEEVKKVLEILQKPKKRNPVLVGDSEPDALLKEVLQRIERKEGVDGALRNLQVISLEKEFASDRSQVTQKLKELGDSLETRLELFRRDSGGGGVILNLGDLKWLVESPNGLVQSSGSINIQLQQLVSEIGRAAVVEMRDLVGRFDEGGGGSGRLWLIGTASCATYLRCQVYHPSMENDWDLQAVPIAPRAPLPSLFPRTAGNGGILSSSVESLAPARGFSPMTATTSPLRRPPDKIDPSRKPMCPSCSESYEEELAKLVETKFQRTNSSSSSIPDQRQPPLPPWLQDAKLGNGATKQDQTREQEQKWKGSTEDLLKKWTETCSSLHSNPNLILQHPFELKPLPLPATQTCSPLRLSNHCGLRPLPALPEQPISPPRSPIRTDLALGRPKASDEQNHRDRITNSGGCVQDFFARQHTREKTGNGNLDAGSFKQLFKGLSETASWQPEAASAIAFTVMQCKSGNGKQRTTGAKRDTWLMFVGPDKVGKKKMAAALSDLVFGPGGGPVIISLSGSSRLDSEDMESNVRFRGKMALDRVAEAVQRDPFAVFVLEDIDQADMLVQGSIMRAMEKGRLPDSHGREVSLGSAVFIMTSNSLPENLRTSDMDSLIQCEEKLEAAMTACWQLELLIEEKTAKRQPEWLCEDDRQTKPRKEHKGGISLDLNLATGMLDEETGDSSRNSSDVTVEHEHRHDYGQLAFKGHSTSMPMELINAVDDTIVFKPVDFGPVRRKVSDALSWKFSSVVGSGWTVQVDEEALDRIVGGIWFSRGADDGFEEWMERVMVPCFCQLKSIKVASVDKLVVKLVTVKDQFPPTSIDGLPSQITITGGGGWPMRAV